MPLNNSRSDIRDRRRQLVAEIMVRRPRVTQRQVRDALTEQGHINPETGEAWSLGTINRDVEAVREQAQKRMNRSAEEWRSQELEMLRELQADAWEEGEYRTVIQVSKRRAKLLGLDEPEQIDAALSLGRSEEFQDALADLMGALEDFPEARQAVARVLAEGEPADADSQ